jgi:hypothetical protein
MREDKTIFDSIYIVVAMRPVRISRRRPPHIPLLFGLLLLLPITVWFSSLPYMVILTAIFEKWMGLCCRCIRGEQFAIGAKRSCGRARRRTDQAERSSQPGCQVS